VSVEKIDKGAVGNLVASVDINRIVAGDSVTIKIGSERTENEAQLDRLVLFRPADGSRVEMYQALFGGTALGIALQCPDEPLFSLFEKVNELFAGLRERCFVGDSVPLLGVSLAGDSLEHFVSVSTPLPSHIILPTSPRSVTTPTP
jgi:hypothetical protein